MQYVCVASNIHHSFTRSSNYTCGILAEPKELVEDSESLRAAANAVALIGGLSMPWGTFTVEGEGGWRA